MTMKNILTLEQLREKLNIAIPKSYENVYEEGCSLYNEGFEFLDKEYFESFNNEYKLFGEYLDVINEARELLKQEDALLLFVCILAKAVLNLSSDEVLDGLNLPKTDDETMKKAYNFAPMFALLPSVERTVERFRERNIPEDVISDTLKQYESVISIFDLRFGYPAYDKVYFGWMLLTVNNAILSIGRLQYEIRDFSGKLCAFENEQGEMVLLADKITVNKNGVGIKYAGLKEKDGELYCEVKETEDYYEGNLIKGGFVTRQVVKLSKKEWTKVLSYGDMSISIHIPRGGSMADDACVDSYKRAKEIFNECYKDIDFKTYFCHSWLLDPQLKALVKPDSNILKFMSRYMLYPYEESENDDVFMFVFTSPFKSYEELPETTSLMRALKKHYISGNYIYVCGGILTE